MRFRTEEEAAFDRDLYLKHRPDIPLEIDPWRHFAEHGWSEERSGMRPSWRAPCFDDHFYHALYPDVQPLVDAGDYASAAEHWFLAGRREVALGVRPVARGFDEQAYCLRRPDVAASIADGTFESGFDHWLQWGRADEGVLLAPISRQKRSNRPSEITSEKAQYWFDKGVLILEGLIEHDRCDAVNARINRLWAERKRVGPPISLDIYLEQPQARRVRLADAPGDARLAACKINDLVMHDAVIGSVALDERLCDVLRWVLDDDPVAIGSLNFERGSTQDFHTDTLYMPGRTPEGMTAAWIALEDVTIEAGPLLYYPGSHEIPAFRFSSGLTNQISEEFENYRGYMTQAVEARGLESEAFLPKKGDVLVWHERLFHAGAPIEDIAQTRKSLVVHYWRHNDMRDKPLIEQHGGYYWNRPPL